jgi:hypothetical protein
LIGGRCKRSDAFSQPVLTVEGLTCGAENLEFSLLPCEARYALRSKTPVQFTNLISLKKSLGDPSGGDTPGPIPNPAVKPASADGTGGAAPWESRSLPRDFLHTLSLWPKACEPMTDSKVIGSDVDVLDCCHVVLSVLVSLQLILLLRLLLCLLPLDHP